jgi:triacylglycerol lipase
MERADNRAGVERGAREAAHRDELVVLLHGLKRTSRSMAPLQRALEFEGYPVRNQPYPSSKFNLATLAARVATALTPQLNNRRVVHFVTHSMGGIVLRLMRANGALPQLGRVVMLAPPNQGSELVDRLGGLKLFTWFNGPAGGELGTAPDSVPNRLPPADFELGIIAGRRSVNPLLSRLIDGPNDGKVSVARTHLKGMRELLVVDHSHTFLASRPGVKRAVVRFLATGHF